MPMAQPTEVKVTVVIGCHFSLKALSLWTLIGARYEYSVNSACFRTNDRLNQPAYCNGPSLAPTTFPRSSVT
jgi:hypothetical protein